MKKNFRFSYGVTALVSLRMLVTVEMVGFFFSPRSKKLAVKSTLILKPAALSLLHTGGSVFPIWRLALST